METMINNATLVPSVVADGSEVADSSYLAVVVAASILALLFIGAMLALLIYRYYKRTSGPVWIHSKLASIRGRYSNMNGKDRNVEDNFIIGFGNPLCDTPVTSEDKADGVTMLGYRKIDENRKQNGAEGHSLHHKLMFPRDRLVYGAVNGIGWFGKVYEGDAYRIKAGWRRTKVVIKELQVNSDRRMKDLFLKETDVYRRIEHKNVVSLLGQATEQEPYLVIMEQTPVGDLKKFLLERRSDNNCDGIPRSLRISIDIASGLHCLHANSFYHGDLAARNCLVFLDQSVKIGDYGISRSIYQSDYYNRSGAPNAVPIRWLPPEDVVIQKDASLTTKPPSSQGNVWSFGVTLWEIIEGGRQPYEHLSDEEVLQSVIEDKLYQLPEPQKKGDVADLLYELMLKCWVDPDRRPPVEKLESALLSLMSRHSVPHLKANALSKVSRLDSAAAADMRAVTQPVAIVRPLRSENSANNEHKKDVEITVIVSESPPPVTYIGDPSDDVGNTSTDVRSSSVSKHLAVESAAEYVVVPGEFIRRRGSILRNPDAPSQPRKTVHFPVNILDLRTIHKYERLESYEEEDIEHEDEEQDMYAINIWSRDSPISSEESGEDLCKFPVERDIDNIDAISRDENKTVSNKEPSSPVEKKLKRAARRKKLEHCGDEWLATLEPETKEL